VRQERTSARGDPGGSANPTRSKVERGSSEPCAGARGRPARCLRVDRTRPPATVVPDGWPSPGARSRYRTRLIGRLVPHTSSDLRRYFSTTRSVRRSTENGVDRLSRLVLGVRPEVRVRVQRLGGRRVPKPSLHDLHRLAMADEERSVVVPQVVKHRLCQAGPLRRRPPDRRREPGPVERVPLLRRKDQAAVGHRKFPKMLRQRLKHDLGEGEDSVGGASLGRRVTGSLPRQEQELPVNGPRPSQEVHSVRGQSKRLTLPKSGAGCQGDQGAVPLRNRRGEGPDGRRGQRDDLYRLPPRQLDPVAGGGRQLSIADGCLEDRRN